MGVTALLGSRFKALRSGGPYLDSHQLPALVFNYYPLNSLLACLPSLCCAVLCCADGHQHVSVPVSQQQPLVGAQGPRAAVQDGCDLAHDGRHHAQAALAGPGPAVQQLLPVAVLHLGSAPVQPPTQE